MYSKEENFTKTGIHLHRGNNLLPNTAIASVSDDSPPLQLHGVEGYGGIANTYSAYIGNPVEKDHVLGKFALGARGLITNGGRFFGFVTATKAIGDRIELGYGYNYLTHNDLHDDIEKTTAIDLSDNAVQTHNFNIRLTLVNYPAASNRASWFNERPDCTDSPQA